MASALRETSRDYANPYRPWPVKIFNKLGPNKPFEIEPLIAEAMRKTKSERFATEAFRAPLEQLLRSLESEAQLTAMGRFMWRQHFVSALGQNLRAGALFAERPQLRQKPLARTVMVCGLARSGTTLLQRMLAELPGARPVPAWEAFEPIPEPGPQPADVLDDPRVARLRFAEKFMRWLSPDLFAVHPMDALAPEEDVLILEHVFYSGVSESSFRLPSFGRWLEAQDQTPAYEWLADCMRVMSERQDGDFWVLKSPHHLEWLDTVFAVLPDVTVVQTHRDPVETVPSFCSLVAHGWGIMTDNVDPKEVGTHWFRKLDRMLMRALATRDARNGQGFYDVDYRDLVRDPIGTVEQLCAKIGLPWSEEIRAHLTGWLAQNRQHKHGVHRYAAEDFGLDESGIAERFAYYRERFGFA